MTAAAAVRPQKAARGRLGAWCGWVLVGSAALVPFLAWFAPLGFAPLVALVGLLCLPAFRLEDEDRPALIVLLGVLVWAAASTTWSPFHPRRPEQSVVLQVALGLPLFWSAVCGARRADVRLKALALRVLAVGLALFGVALLVETALDAGIYRGLHDRYYPAIQPAIAENRLGHASSILATFWPAAIAGWMRRRWEVGLLAVAVVATVVAGHVFRADAPIVALPICSAAMLVVWLWPKVGPRLLAAGFAAASLAMPLLVWAVREAGHFRAYEQAVAPSWAARMSFWSAAVDRIAQRPFTGWGLDASRTFGPGMGLHPHNTALQVWLELGVPGAVAAATFWGLSVMRLSREEPDLEMAGVAGSVTAYLLFSWINYGMWQGWWLALGAYLAVIAAMLSRSAETPKSTKAPISG